MKREKETERFWFKNLNQPVNGQEKVATKSPGPEVFFGVASLHWWQQELTTSRLQQRHHLHHTKISMPETASASTVCSPFFRWCWGGHKPFHRWLENPELHPGWMMITDWWEEAGQSSTQTKKLTILTSFSSCRGHHPPQSTTCSWDVPGITVKPGGQGMLGSPRYRMRKLLANAIARPLLSLQTIPQGLSLWKVQGSDKVWDQTARFSHLCQAWHVCSTFLSTTYNSLILLAAVACTRSVPLAHKMFFQIKLLFSLIKLHLWAKTATLIQLNHHCLQLSSRAECTEVSQTLTPGRTGSNEATGLFCILTEIFRIQ